MSQIIDIYKFRGINDFYADMRGNFFITVDDRPIKKEVHESRLVIRWQGRRYGMKPCARLPSEAGGRCTRLIFLFEIVITLPSSHTN